MGHFELTSSSRNKIFREKPRKKFNTSEVRVVRTKSGDRHEIQVALVTKQTLRKDSIYYAEIIKKCGFGYALPLIGLLSIFTITVINASRILSLI